MWHYIVQLMTKLPRHHPHSLENKHRSFKSTEIISHKLCQLNRLYNVQYFQSWNSGIYNYSYYTSNGNVLTVRLLLAYNILQHYTTIHTVSKYGYKVVLQFTIVTWYNDWVDQSPNGEGQTRTTQLTQSLKISCSSVCANEEFNTLSPMANVFVKLYISNTLMCRQFGCLHSTHSLR